MRKILVALALLLACAAGVPAAFAGGPPAAADLSPAPISSSPSAAHPAADFALWLAQSGPGANPAAGCTAQICNECVALGKVCCIISARCVCAPPTCGR